MKFTGAALRKLKLSAIASFCLLLSSSPPCVQTVDAQIVLSSGAEYVCAFHLPSALLKCWGFIGPFIYNHFLISKSPTEVFFDDFVPIHAQADGLGLCMFSNDDNDNVECVGKNDKLQLGTDHYPEACFPEPSMIGLGTKIAKMDMGINHSCVITAPPEEYVYCVGLNTYGQLGHEFTWSASPGAVIGLDEGTKVKDVAVGQYHTCLVNHVRDLFCMGSNSFGQLGLGHEDDKNTPTAVNLGGMTVEKLTCGAEFTCILDNLAKIRCTGWNENGELGVGDLGNRNVFTAVNHPDENYQALKLAAGWSHACFTLVTGVINCMGKNEDGQLGNGGTSNSNIPVQVNMPEGIIPVDLALGDRHSCVSTDDVNIVFCWGDNSVGSLGDGTNRDSSIPILVKSLDFPRPASSSPTTTEAPTESPTTESPTVAPTDAPTDAPTTAAPTTASPTTASPTTASPTTESPTTESPTTTAPVPAPVVRCTDRTDSWSQTHKNGTKRTRSWCTFAANLDTIKLTLKTCRQWNLYSHCPITCERPCPATEAPVTPAPVTPAPVPAGGGGCCDSLAAEIADVKTKLDNLQNTVDQILGFLTPQSS